MFAEVAVDTYQDPSRKIFTYRIPEELTAKAQEGAKVLVPFGKRTAEGYIFKLKKVRPSFPTREIKEVKGRTLTQAQVRLAQWMSEYYFAPPLDCIKCQLPGKGQRYREGEQSEIKTLILVPYAAQVRIKALELNRNERRTTLIGSRSAIFTPLPNLKEIIIEEPENWTYKEERSPYYHAKDVAQKRAELEGLKLELRYLIPRVEDLPSSKKGPLSSNLSGLQIQIIDMQKEREAGNFSPLGKNLTAVIRQQKPVLTLVNSKEAKEQVRQAIKEQNLDANRTEIAGTEVFSQIGKKYAAVAIIDADTLFNLPDFRAHEKLVTTIAKLAQLTNGSVYIQTSNTLHPIFEELKTGNLGSFYQRELETRKPFLYPPFGTLAKLEFSAKKMAKVEEEAGKLYQKLSEISDRGSGLSISPPYPPYSRSRGKAQLNIAVKAKRHQDLAKILACVPCTWRIIVEPESLL